MKRDDITFQLFSPRSAWRRFFDRAMDLMGLAAQQQPVTRPDGADDIMPMPIGYLYIDPESLDVLPARQPDPAPAEVAISLEVLPDAPLDPLAFLPDDLRAKNFGHPTADGGDPYFTLSFESRMVLERSSGHQPLNLGAVRDLISEGTLDRVPGATPEVVTELTAWAGAIDRRDKGPAPAFYDCQESGYPKPERRAVARGPRNEKVEHLFNGFQNLIDTAKVDGDDYGAAYVAAMGLEFAALARLLPPAADASA